MPLASSDLDAAGRGRLLLDAAWRLAYRIAFLLLRVWWALRRPVRHGVVIAVWCGGRVLILRQSYRPGATFPGGGRGNDPFGFRDADNNRDSDDLGWMQDVSRTGRRGAVPVRRLNGSVELRDRASGRVVWTAILSCDRQGDDQAALIGTLVGAVVPAIGQTVAGRAF